MFWLAAMAAFSAIQQGEQAKAQAKATNTINKANTAAQNITRQSNNVLQAAAGSLQRMQDSLGNQQKLRNAGIAQDKLSQQHIELGRQMTTGGMMQRLQAAEQAGQLQAATSAAGVGGSTVAMLESVNRLQSQIQQDQTEDDYKRAVFQTDEAQTENLYQMYQSLDNNAYLDPLAYSDVVGPQKVNGPSNWNIALNAGVSALGQMYKAGDFNKGGTFDISQSSGGVSGLLKRAFGGAKPQQ